MSWGGTLTIQNHANITINSYDTVSYTHLDAVENGNKKSVGRALKGLFVIRYDDEGRLLLKEEDFK